MTAMCHYLAVLPAGQSVYDLTSNWRSEVKRYVECTYKDWLCAPNHLEQHENKKLEWGTWAYEVEDGDLASLLREGVRKSFLKRKDSEKLVAIWYEIG